jgi:hypothetical protein
MIPLSKKPPPTKRDSEKAIGWFQTKVKASTNRPRITRIPDTRNCLGFNGSFVLILLAPQNLILQIGAIFVRYGMVSMLRYFRLSK